MLRRFPTGFPLWLAALALAGLAACGEPSVDAMDGAAGIVLSPTDTLLDRADGWAIASYPETGLPADIAIGQGEVAASGVLRVRPDEWDTGDALPAPFRRSLALPSDARVYQRDDAGQVLQRLWNQLPVVFAVTAQADGTRHELWTRTVTAQDGFIEDVVDLSGLPDGPVTLRLETQRAEDTDGNWPFGFWADLSLSGRRTMLPSMGMPTVIVIDVDSLRADRLGAYGHSRDTTPRLDSWAASHATVYKDVVAAADWTLPSTTSLLTGLSVDQHGMQRFPQVLGDTTPLLSTRLRDAGYLSAEFGFDQGFDVFDQRGFQSPRWHEALDWLEQRDDGRPAFLFLHTYLTHAPWRADPRFADPVAPYAGPLRQRDVTYQQVIKPYEDGRLELTPADRAYIDEMYDASVARLDDYLMDFLARLDTIVPPSERVVIITSDHGEELFGHGRVQHGGSLYSDVLSVPLIVQYPDRPYGRVDLAPASGVDLVPTVLDTLELEVPRELAGRSLREATIDPIARIAQHGDAHAVQFDGWKLIVGPVAGSAGRPGGVQLYDLHTDPGELEDIAEAVPEWVRRLEAMLDESRQANRPLGPRPGEGRMDPAVLGDLRMLGTPRGR